FIYFHRIMAAILKARNLQYVAFHGALRIICGGVTAPCLQALFVKSQFGGVSEGHWMLEDKLLSEIVDGRESRFPTSRRIGYRKRSRDGKYFIGKAAVEFSGKVPQRNDNPIKAVITLAPLRNSIY